MKINRKRIVVYDKFNVSVSFYLVLVIANISTAYFCLGELLCVMIVYVCNCIVIVYVVALF